MSHYASCHFPIFFFSSRRRHTRFKCDWSSDVCSSDLLRISVMQQIAASSQASPLLHSHVSRLLLHPLLIRVRRESCQFHLATLQVDEEQHVIGRQPFER